MPRLNGKFVSKAVFEAAMATEENTVSEVTANEVADEFEADVADEAPAVDRRTGQRPGTALKKARLALVNAEHKRDQAQLKLNAFDHGRDELQAAVDAAQLVVDAAVGAVSDEAAAL